ncbi:Adenylate kinase 9 [Taenia solium]
MVNGMNQTVKEDLEKDVEEVENMVMMMATVIAKEGAVDEVEVEGEEGGPEVHLMKVMEKGGTVAADMAEVADVEEREEVMIHTMKTTVAEAVEDVVDAGEGRMEVTILMAPVVMEDDAGDVTVVGYGKGGRGGRGGKGGRGGSSDGSDEDAEWRRRRYRKIDDPLEKRYDIPSAEADRMPDEILKHFAYVDAESTRRDWLRSHSGTLTDIPAEDSTLVALKKALLTTTHRMAHVMEYESNRRRGRPMSISEIGLTMKQFEKKLGEFGNYCPVRFAENNELFDCREEHTAPLVTRLPGAEGCLPNARYNSAFASTSLRYIMDISDVDLHPHIPTDLRFAVEYNGKTYRTAGPEELRKFMANPEKYLPPQALKGLPEENDLPKRLPAGTIARDSFPRQIALRGFCPVCFQESGQHYEGLREGAANILALYQGQIYAFCSEECRNKFMHRPWLFADLKLPNKLPPMKAAISVDELPLPGYLEQTVAYVLRNALAMCSKFRPKYPFLTPERSALIYMALQLKALNPRTPDYLRFRAKSRVERFERACRLIDQLAAIMPVDYQAECQRSETLSRQLHEFLSLQDQVDNEDRWIYSI